MQPFLPSTTTRTHPSYYREMQLQPSSQAQARSKVDFFKTSLSDMDLNIQNYELHDIYRLFNITSSQLTEPIMKHSRLIMLHMHPDKSGLDPKFFRFFQQAYARLNEIYSFQQGSQIHGQSGQSISTSSTQYTPISVLTPQQEQAVKSAFGHGSGFASSEFNAAFEQRNGRVEEQHGHGDWLKSDDSIFDTRMVATKGTLDQSIEAQRRRMQSVVKYSGDFEPAQEPGTYGSSLYDTDNYSSSKMGQYVDLKQAYMESVLPVSERDFQDKPYRTVDEYVAYRDRVQQQVRVPNKTEALRILEEQSQLEAQQSAAMVYKLAQQAEEMKKKEESFWSKYMQIKN